MNSPLLMLVYTIIVSSYGEPGKKVIIKTIFSVSLILAHLFYSSQSLGFWSRAWGSGAEVGNSSTGRKVPGREHLHTSLLSIRHWLIWKLLGKLRLEVGGTRVESDLSTFEKNQSIWRASNSERWLSPARKLWTWEFLTAVEGWRKHS